MLPLITFIPNYYIQDLGVSASLVGTALLFARLLDVVTDPLVGYLSDRTQSRFGSRKVWMLAGLPITAASVYALFFPGPSPTIWWFFFSTASLWLGWTMIFVPYYAWATELSDDYNERSRITGWRTSCGLIASAVSQAIPAAALVYFGYGGTPAVVTMIGIMMLLLLPVTVGLTLSAVPEPARRRLSPIGFLPGLRVMWRNGPFRRLITAFFVSYIGTAISSTLFIFYVRGVLGAENLGITVLLVNYLASLAGIPFWVWLSARIGKHKAWCVSVALFVAASPLYLLLSEGDVLWIFPLIAVIGIANGAFVTLGNSMKADVIDLDSAMSGENRAGVYIAAWSMALKFALAIGPAIVLWALSTAGLEASPGLIEDPGDRRLLKYVFILSAPICYIAAALLVWGYPITEQRHKRLIATLARRDKRRALRRRGSRVAGATPESPYKALSSSMRQVRSSGARAPRKASGACSKYESAACAVRAQSMSSLRKAIFQTPSRHSYRSA